MRPVFLLNILYNNFTIKLLSKLLRDGLLHKGPLKVLNGTKLVVVVVVIFQDYIYEFGHKSECVTVLMKCGLCMRYRPVLVYENRSRWQ